MQHKPPETKPTDGFKMHVISFKNPKLHHLSELQSIKIERIIRFVTFQRFLNKPCVTCCLIRKLNKIWAQSHGPDPGKFSVICKRLKSDHWPHRNTVFSIDGTHNSTIQNLFLQVNHRTNETGDTSTVPFSSLRRAHIIRSTAEYWTLMLLS